VSYDLWKYKSLCGLPTFFTQTIFSTQSTALQQNQKNNMQFKVITALFFSTLAAASTLPTNPGNSNPGNTDTSKTPTTPTTGNTNPGSTNQGTNQNTNKGANKVNPPYPATGGGAPPTISASKCSAGHLLCCKFHFPKIVIVLQLLLKGKTAGLPTDPTVEAHLPSGISKDGFSGYAGIDCNKLPDAALPNTWFVSTRSSP
jgi:hypothetical protein